jgi:hypothetical protein
MPPRTRRALRGKQDETLATPAASTQMGIIGPTNRANASRPEPPLGPDLDDSDHQCPGDGAMSAAGQKMKLGRTLSSCVRTYETARVLS